MHRTIARTALTISVSAAAVAPASAAPWIMRHGLTDTGYQDFYDDELPAGYRPVSVDVHGSGSAQRFAAVWINDGQNDWEARHNMTSDQYNTEALDLAALGYRVIAVDAAGSFPNEEYVAAWVNDGVAPADWGALHRRTSGQLATDMTNYANAGFRPVCFSGTGSGSNTRFAASFVRNFEGYTYDVIWDLNETQYQDYVEDRAVEGYRVMHVTAYGTDADPRLGAIFVRTDGANWERGKAWFARHNQNGTDFQDTATDYENTLYQPTSAVQYGASNSPEFAAAWFKDTPAPTFTAKGAYQAGLANFDSAMEFFMTSRQIQRGALAITKDGRMVYNRAFTYDYPAQWDTKPAHRFRVASVSKPITAVAVLKAVELGLFDLGDSLEDIPGFDDSGWRLDDDVPANVTIDMLLKHQGGWDRSLDPMLNDVNIADAENASLPLTFDTIMENTKSQKLKFNPGGDYEYSNFGYALLGHVIELTSGQTYEDFVREHVLCPIGAEGMVLGFTGSQDLHPNEVNYTDPMYRRFPSVMSDDRPLALYPYARYNIENMDAHGGWVATAEELAKFVSDFTDKTASVLLPEADIDYMFDENSQTNAYGAGWQRTGSVRYHNGSLRGTWAFIIRRTDGVTISVMFNGRSNGVNTPIADDDWDIYTNLNAAANEIGATPSLWWPEHDLFTPGDCQEPDCSADITGDGVVDGADLARLLAAWGQRNPLTDLNGDGATNGGDLAILLAAWGLCR